MKRIMRTMAILSIVAIGGLALGCSGGAANNGNPPANGAANAGNSSSNSAANSNGNASHGHDNMPMMNGNGRSMDDQHRPSGMPMNDHPPGNRPRQ